MRIDLHVHSTASDGAFAPAEVVDRARAGNLDVIAVADHDTVAGIAPARAAAARSIHVVPAIEVSATDGDREVHILGYGIDPDYPAMTAYGARAKTVRAERIREMIRRLAGLGVHVEFEDVLAVAGPDAAALARPHLARVLHEQNLVSTVSEAFDRYIGDRGPAFVPVRLLDARHAISTIHEAGGIAVWAHPSTDGIQETLADLLDAGIDGLECFRPRATPRDVQRVSRLARRHDLLVSGGSDWHGDWHGPLGRFHVEQAQIAPLLDRLGI